MRLVLGFVTMVSLRVWAEVPMGTWAMLAATSARLTLLLSAGMLLLVRGLLGYPTRVRPAGAEEGEWVSCDESGGGDRRPFCSRMVDAPGEEAVAGTAGAVLALFDTL